jgi:hypothetical protein
MSDPGPIEVRASDAERERAADVLRHAAGEGRLTVEELGERLDSAYAARTRGELDRLVADVQVPRSAGASGLTVRPEGDEGTRHLVAIMGGNDVKLGEANPTPGGPTLRLRLISIMGGSDVRRGRKLTRAERREQRKLHRWHG